MAKKTDATVHTGTDYLAPYQAICTALAEARTCLDRRQLTQIRALLEKAKTHTHHFFDAAGRRQQMAEELVTVSVGTVLAIISALRDLLNAVEHCVSLAGAHGTPGHAPEPRTRAPSSKRPSRTTSRKGS